MKKITQYLSSIGTDKYMHFTSNKPVRFGGSTSYSAYSDSAGQWSLFLYDGGSWNSTFARGRLF